MKCWIISDTHNYHQHLIWPKEARMVIHCGDATKRSTINELREFADWFKSLPIQYKIFVPGNHDWYLTAFEYEATKDILGPDIHLLVADCIEVEGIKIFGSAYDGYKNCPEHVGVLITHEPPNSILDELPAFSKFNPDPHPLHIGSVPLLTAVVDKIKPKYHMFGHVHECGGRIEVYRDITFINAAVLDEHYQMMRAPGIVIDIDPLQLHVYDVYNPNHSTG